MVNLFGGSGYIGSRYDQLYPTVLQPRDDLVPKSDQVLYMISTTHNHHLPHNPWIDVDTNITTLLRVLENCRHREVREFNFVSSWFVYGSVTAPASEHQLCDPRGFYSITKHTAEQLLRTYCEMHGITWRIIRLANVIGGYDTKGGGAKNFLQRLCWDLVHGQSVWLANRGEIYRDYLHRDDACSGINRVIDHGSANTIYNIGTGTSVTVRTAAEYLVGETHSASVISFGDPQAVQHCWLDCARVRDLGWQARHGWQYSVQDTLREVQSRIIPGP